MGIQIGKAGLNQSDRIDFLKNLSSWLNAGGGRTSVGEAVANTCDAFSHDEFATLKQKMDMIREDVKRGQVPFYQALLQADIGFTTQEINIIEAAERSSQLREAVPALIAALDVQFKAKRELMSKLLGPVVLGLVMVGLTLAVLTYMLPLVITPVLDRNPEKLNRFPLILKIFWHVSVWLRANYVWLIAVASVPIGCIIMRNSTLLSPLWQRIILSWNLSRRIILGFNGLILVYFMPALLRSGMPTYKVLYSLADCLSNRTLAAQIRIAGSEHENGMRMYHAMQSLPFKASLTNAVAAGEQTGAIADRVSELQEPYKVDLERLLKTVAGALKFLVMAFLLPLFIVSAYTALVGPIFALMEY